MSTRFNDELFLQVAANAGYNLEVGSLESYILGIEETELEMFLEGEVLPEYIVSYSAMIKGVNKCFSICVNWDKQELEGIIAGAIIDMVNGEIIYIKKEDLKLEEMKITNSVGSWNFKNKIKNENTLEVGSISNFRVKIENGG